MQESLRQEQKYYFSNKLKKQLDQISNHSLTIIEAPSGFSKTTAIKEYLKERTNDDVHEYWYTCLGASTSMAWRGICDVFSNIDPKAADNLRNLKMPTKDTLLYIIEYIRGVYCEAETYLVIDNYQLIDFDIPYELIGVFSMHRIPNLHIIIITQQLKSKRKLCIHENDILTVDSSYFIFDKTDILNLFQIEDIYLTGDQLEEVFRSTEGWISAIRMQIIKFKETGSFNITSDIEKLVEESIWEMLTAEEKDFLVSVSVMDSFNVRQAAILMGEETLPNKTEQFIKNHDFIRYIPEKKIYVIHSILKDYLQTRLYHYKSEDYKNKIFRNAGDAYASISKYFQAAEFFFKIKDFDAIFSLPFSREYLSNQKEKCNTEFIEIIINECPEEILCKYPNTMIVFGYQMLMCGNVKSYQKLCGLIGLSILIEDRLDQMDIQRIKGEYMLLISLGDFNDVFKMEEGQRKALKILNSQTDMIKSDTPWLFAATSTLSMLWSESGKLKSMLEQADRFRPIYRDLAKGYGGGAINAMKAEAMLMKGDDNEAEILCYKAFYEARNYKQTGICISIELILAQIAILRGDVKSYFTLVENIKNYAKENSDLYILHMVEESMSIISMILGIEDYMASWLYDMENIKEVIYAPAVPHVKTLYSKLLLIKKRYNELYGVSQLILDEIRNKGGSMKYMMPQVYLLIYLAIANRNNGNDIEAQRYLNEAFDIALADEIYLPFAQQDNMEDFISEILVNNSANYKSDYSSYLTAISSGTERLTRLAELRKLCQRQSKGVRIIRKAIQQDKSPLTPREREVANLARDRLTAKEIADKLYISEATVRTILKNVYRKLDIHSKKELNSKEF